MSLDTEIFKIAAGVAILLALYIMVKTDIGAPNNKDPFWVQRCRILGFAALAMVLGYAIWRDASRESLLMLFYSGIYSLMVNALAIYLRK